MSRKTCPNGVMMMSSLPPNVRPTPDRHGKVRYRFRRKGWASAYLPGAPGDAEFHAAYAEIIAGGPAQAGPVASPRKVIPKSLDDAFARLKRSVRWKDQKPSTIMVYGRMIERFLDRTDKRKGRRYGERPCAAVTVAWLERILSDMASTPAAANNLRKALRRVMAQAVKAGWRSDNPVMDTDTFKEGSGYHCWTEDEIAQYRAHHALGTMARLTLELALNSAARRCNVAALTRDNIKGGRIVVAHAKDGDETSVQLLATTRAALAALPAQPINHLITTSRGKPFSVAGFGNKVREWCNDAGLSHCSLHGLRKAMSRRIAEAGGTDAQGQAITGHKKAETFAYYRARANRVVLADGVMPNLEQRFDAQPSEKDDKSDA